MIPKGANTEEARAFQRVAWDGGVRMAQLAVYQEVTAGDRQAVRREFINLLTRSDSTRGRRGMWFGLLSLAHYAVISVSGFPLALYQKTWNGLNPTAQQLRNTMIEKVTIEAVTAELVEKDPDSQMLDLYDLAVNALTAVFEATESHTMSAKWQVFALLTARRDKLPGDKNGTE